MTHRSVAALKAEIASLLADNTSGAISAGDVRSILGDITDSFDEKTLPAAAINHFSLPQLSSTIDIGETFTGLRTFALQVDQPSQVGNVTFFIGSTQLATTPATIAATATTGQINIPTTITLAPGASLVIQARASAGQTPLTRNDTIFRRNYVDYTLLDAITGSTATTADITRLAALSANRAVTNGAGSTQRMTIPTFTGSRRLLVMASPTRGAVTEIIVGGLNQIGAFTKTSLTFSGANWDVYISNNPQLATAISGIPISVVR